MKFSYGFPFFVSPPNPNFLKPEVISGIGQAAETAGFYSAFFSEHPIPTQNWRESGGHDSLDPFVALSFVAASTIKLKLLTNLTVVPYRNPFLFAKAAATLDVVSAGRLILGLGTGYLKGEYFALGVDFEERNELFDEAIEVVRQAFLGEVMSYEGRHFSAKDVAAQPLPVQKPHPPFWLGGNSKLTRRRVAEWGQGWMPMPNPKKLAERRRSPALETPQELKEMIAYMNAHAESIGRELKKDPIEIAYMTFEGGIAGAKDFELSKHLEAIGELAELGVNHLIVSAVGEDLNEVKDQIAFVGSEIIDATN